MHAFCEHDAGDRMINAAKLLHRGRRQPDLVAFWIAMRPDKKPDVFFLNIVGVQDRGGRVPRCERLEAAIFPVFGEQRLGCEMRGDILHEASPFSLCKSYST